MPYAPLPIETPQCGTKTPLYTQAARPNPYPRHLPPTRDPGDRIPMTHPSQASSATGPSAHACYRHPDALAREACARCRRPICEGCSTFGSELATMCPSCVNVGARRSRFIAASVGVAALGLVGAGVFFVATQPPPITYGEHHLAIERLTARVAASPCDQQSTLELMELLNKERDFPRTIRVSEAFQKSCEPAPRLLWPSYGARMEVQDFKGAIADADALIAHRPEDGDFWWWRAKAKRAAGDLEGTEQDLRRSVELTGARGYYNTLDLIDLLEKSERACEAVPLLAVLADRQEKKPARERLEARLGRLVRETPCPAPGRAPKGEAPAFPCATLPSQIDFGSDAPTGLATSLRNTWAARTRPMAKGAPLSCRMDYAENDLKGSAVFKGTSMRSWTARLSCDGQPSVLATQVGVVELKAQEELVDKLVNEGIKRWCDAS